MKQKKRVLALWLALLMLLSVGCGGKDVNEGPEETGAIGEDYVYPEYLNLDSAYPVIKDEYAGTIKLRVAVVQTANGGEWDHVWVSKYLREKYNIELEVESIQESALFDIKNLMFNSGELPDLMLNMALTTGELDQYGAEDGLLLQIDQYMNEKLTPYMLKYFNSSEEARNNCTALDGHMYTLPWAFDSTDAGIYDKIFMNKAMLDELGIEMPRTLDEFTDALYKIKAADLNDVGSENVYPFSGGMGDSTFYLLNALGYMTLDGYGLTPALRDGEVTIPIAEMDIYKEFLTLLNQYYVDGIINPNFFNLNDIETLAQLSNGQIATFRWPVHLYGVGDFTDWEAAYPLTSDYQTEPEWPLPNLNAIGNFCISADTEYPELCMRIAELYFNNETDDCRALWVGVSPGHEYSFDYPTQLYNEEAGQIQWETEVLPNGKDGWAYLMEDLIGFYPRWGIMEIRESCENHYNMTFGEEYPDPDADTDMTDPENFYRYYVKQNVIPYATETYPYVYYIQEDMMEEVDEIYAVINPYAREQIALFITGRRPLSETDAFAQELSEMGMDRLVDIYKQVYDDYKNN